MVGTNDKLLGENRRFVAGEFKPKEAYYRAIAAK